MDDVDYLVEDNTCLSPEMDGTHGMSTFEENATVGNVPTIISA